MSLPPASTTKPAPDAPALPPHLLGLQRAIGALSWLLRGAIALLAAAFLLSGITSTEPHESALIMQYGRPRAQIEGSRLVLALPYPFEEVVKLPTGRTQSLSCQAFMPAISEAERAGGLPPAPPASLDLQKDGFLLCSGLDIVHASADLTWRIEDPVAFLAAFGPDPGLQRAQSQLQILLRASLTAAAAGLNAAAARDGRSLSDAATLHLSRSCATLRLGLRPERLNLSLSLPAQIQPQSLELTRASQEAAQIRTQAQTKASGLAAEAQTLADRRKSLAETRRAASEAYAKLLAANVLKLSELYDRDPAAARSLIMRDRLQQIMAGLQEIYLADLQSDKVRLQIPRRAPLPKSTAQEPPQ